jgi:hypothetical protein
MKHDPDVRHAPEVALQEGHHFKNLALTQGHMVLVL